MADEVKAFVILFEEWGYFRKDAKDADFGKVLNRFADQLDPQHLFISADGLSALSKKYPGPEIKKLLHNGSIAPAYEAFALYRKAVEDRCSWAVDQLATLEFDADSSIGVPAYPEERKSTQRELDAVWTQTLRHELALVRLSGAAQGEERKSVAAQLNNRAHNAAIYSKEEVGAVYLRAVAKLYDPWGDYFAPRSVARLETGESGQSMGFGAWLKEDPVGAVITEVLRGGPAETTGRIAPGDLLVAIRNSERERIDLAGLQLSQITDFTRGPAGTQLDVLVLHPNSFQQEWVRVTRRSVPKPCLRTFLVRPSQTSSLTLGVISVPALYGFEGDEHKGNVSVQLAQNLERLSKEGAQGLVLDLRKNVGGLLREAVQVTGQFLGNVGITRVMNCYGEIKEDAAEHIEKIYTKPLVVLVDEGTASGAEIVAGALQNYGRAVVVGTGRTYGNGYVQTVIELKGGNRRLARSKTPAGLAKITVQAFYLPNGQSTEVEGITPDIRLPNPAPVNAAENHNRFKQPTPERLSSRISAVTPNWIKTLEVLKTSSVERQQKLPEWLYYQRYNVADRVVVGPQETFAALLKRLSDRTMTLSALKSAEKALREQSAELNELTLLETPSHASKADRSGVDSPVGSLPSEQPLDVPLQEALRVLADLVAHTGPKN